jgi:RNA polymerase sigma factor (TIGR02999 family)
MYSSIRCAAHLPGQDVRSAGLDLPTIATFLQRAETGDHHASAELQEFLYRELRDHARRLMRDQSAEATLQATALVHEAWLKLARHPDTKWSDRTHFLRVAAKAMRQVLVDHARARGAKKRAGDKVRVEFDDLFVIFEERASDLVGLDEALDRLASFDEQLARIVDLRFFVGLSIEETAKVLGISHATVERGWHTARTWLKAELQEDDDEPQ